MLIKRRNWFCAQIGAREHYAVARALQKRGRLASLYTDFWAGPRIRKLAGEGWRQNGNPKVEGRNLERAFGPLRSLAARYHHELGGVEAGDLGSEMGRQKADIVSWNCRSLWWERRLRRRTEGGDLYLGFNEVGSRFAVRVREALKRRSDLQTDSIFLPMIPGRWKLWNGVGNRASNAS